VLAGDLVKLKDGGDNLERDIPLHWTGIVMGIPHDYELLPECWLVAWSGDDTITQTREWEDELIIISKGAK
tara:strand:+ start:89 stop:301 length:213 start_codon:yes stop_codon:yes gene_type:complete